MILLLARVVRDVPRLPDTYRMNLLQFSYPVVLSAESPTSRWRHAK